MAATDALIKVLPNVTSADRGRLSDTEMQTLLGGLSQGSDKPTTAILKALEKMGDARALPAVEKLAVRSESSGVREAAALCLPYLRIQAEQEAQSRTLLRASSAAEAANPDVLLRPAGTSHPESGKMLLRAAPPKYEEGTESPCVISR